MIAEFSSRIIVFFVIVWLANYLGDDLYGELSYAFAIANILVVVADFGLSTYVVRELSRDTSKTREFITQLLGLKIVLSVLTVGLIILVGWLLGNINMLVAVLGGSAIIFGSNRMFVESFFRAHQRMALEAITKIIGGILLAGILSYFIWQQADIESIALAYFIANTISIIIALVVLYVAISPYRIAFSLRRYRAVLLVAWPFALSLAINYLYNYMDSAMLGMLDLKTAAGWYAAAYKPIFFLTAVAGMVINAFFPVLSKSYAESKDSLQSIVSQLFKINSTIAWPMAIGGTVIATDLVTLLYNPEYAPAGLAFQILIWSTSFIYLWAVFGNSLQACNREKTYLRGFAWGAVLNIILNIILIPLYSLYGAAAATLITQLFLFVYMYMQFKSIAHVPIIATTWKPFISAVIMGSVLVVLPAIGLVGTILVGILVYILLLFILRGITKNDITFMLSLWKK